METVRDKSDEIFAAEFKLGDFNGTDTLPAAFIDSDSFFMSSPWTPDMNGEFSSDLLLMLCDSIEFNEIAELLVVGGNGCEMDVLE